jgi:hypothetical protein
MLTHVLAVSENETGVIVTAITIGGGLLVAIVAIVTQAITKISQTKAREESRREIAAYVAEGTISPDDATKMLNAGTLAGRIDQFKQKLNI